MAAFDWHSGEISRATKLDASYRNTQRVRRFFKAECGDTSRFDRAFMAWLQEASGKTMGDAVDEWLRRTRQK